MQQQPLRQESSKDIAYSSEKKGTGDSWVKVYADIAKNLQNNPVIEDTEKEIEALYTHVEESKKKGAKQEELLKLISKDLQNISQKIERIEELGEIFTPNEKIQTLRKIESRIRRKIEVEEGSQKYEQKLQQVQAQKFAILVRSLYKIDRNLPSNLVGEKIDILDTLAKQKIKSYDDFRKLPEEFQNELFEKLNRFHQKINSFKRNNEIDSNTTKNKLKKEKEKYLRGAELKDLEEKLQTDKYMTPKLQKRYLELALKTLKEINSLKNSKSIEDQAILSLLEKNKIEIEENDLKTLEDYINNFGNELRTSLLRVNDVKTRETIIRSKQKELKDTFIKSEGQLKRIHEIIEETKYENQIKQRFETLSTFDKESLETQTKGLKDFINSYMKEYEETKREEREGSVEKRKSQAENLLRRRILEEFNDLERLRALYGDKYAKEIEIESDPRKIQEKLFQKKKELIEEINEKYNFGPNSEAYGDNANQTIQEQIEISKKIETTIDNILQTQIGTNKIIEEIDLGDKEKVKSNLRIDLKLSRLRSELSSLSENEWQEIRTKLNSIPIIQEEDVDKLLSHDIFSKSLEFKQKAESLKYSFDSINKLFVDGNFEVSSGPNGIVVALKDTLEFNKAILGPKNTLEKDYLETLALTLKNSDAMRRLSKELGVSEWNGNVMIVSSNRGENELIHEAQHAVLRSTLPEFEDSKDRLIAKALEELAIKIATGEIWEELCMDPELQSKERLSLASLAYVLPNTFQEISDKERREVEKKLNIVLELSKHITQTEIDNFEVSHAYQLLMSENTFGPVIADIILSNLTKTGVFDLDNIIKELINTFQNDEKHQFNLKKKLSELEKFYPSPGTFFGENEMPIDQVEKLIEKYNLYSNNKGFDFAVVSTTDFRGRENIEWDHKMDPTVGTSQPAKVGGPLAAEIPIINYLYQKRSGKTTGSTEYHIADGLGSIFNPFNYKFRGRAWGGIIRKLQKVPIIGLPFKLVPENYTKFGTSAAKIFCDLPPFGRGWEHIMKDLFPDQMKKISKAFPGRPKPIESTSPNASELWNHQIKVANADLMQGGLDLSQEQMLRIFGGHPSVVFEYELGRPKFELSRRNLDELDNDGFHRGRIKDDFLNDLKDESLEFNMITNNYFNVGKIEKKDKDKTITIKHLQNNYENGVSVDVIEETRELATHMKEMYNNETYPYTINDLITASHLVHDLGINVINGGVRNAYYEEIQEGGKFSETKDTKFGTIKKGKVMWYSLEDPSLRGVVVGDKCFTYKSAHELIRKYNLYYVYKQLLQDIPDITPKMQSNFYEPDYDLSARIINSKTNEAISEDDLYELIQKKDPIIKNLISTDDLSRGLRLKDDFGWVYDESEQKHFIHKTRTVNNRKVHNKFYVPPGYAATGVKGIKGNSFLANTWLKRVNSDFQDTEAGMEKEFSLANDYYELVGDIGQYERKAYFSKTFWGDTIDWTQKIGTAVMLSSLFLGSITGSPIFLAIILGTAAIEAPLVYFMQRQFKLMGERRKMALQARERIWGAKGAIDNLLKGGSSRAERDYIENTLLGGLLAAMEDIAKEPVPPESFPKNDNAIKLWSAIFGEKGLVDKGIESLGK